MEAKKKTSLLYIACAAILLTLLGSFVMFLALSTDFTPALGYFAKGSLTAFLLYIVLAAGILLGGIVWFCLRRCRLTGTSLPMPLYTKAASVLLIAALWPLGLTGIWLNFAGTSVLAAALSAVVMLRFRKDFRRVAEEAAGKAAEG